MLRRFHSTIYSPIHYSFIHLFMYSLFNFSTLNYPLNINLVTYSSYHLLFKSLIICSYIHLFFFSFAHLFICPSIHFIVYQFFHSFIYSFIYLFIFPFIHNHSSIDSSINKLIYSFEHLLSLFMSLHLLYHSSSLLSFC